MNSRLITPHIIHLEPVVFKIKDYTNALKDYDKAIDLAPEDSENYNNRADLYKDIEDYSNALKDYAKVIEISSDSNSTSRAYNNRASCSSQEKYDLAIDELSKAIIENGHYIFQIEQYTKTLRDKQSNKGLHISN